MSTEKVAVVHKPTMRRAYDWDGEKIKLESKIEDIKISPKDMLNNIDRVRADMDKMKGQEVQIQQQTKNIKENQRAAEEYLKEILPFEEKCVELQIEKLKLYISQIKDEAETKARTDSDKEITEAGESMSDAQKKVLPYMMYQKIIGTNTKVAENICNRIIRQHLFADPVFENPFK